MSVFDLKKAVVSFTDGRLATLTTTAVAGVNGEIVLTDKSKHRGNQPPITITIVVGGISTTLLVTVGGTPTRSSPSGTDITVRGATDGSSVGTTTATQMAAAIAANTDAAALVTIAQAGSGVGLISAQAKTSLANGPRTFSVRVAEGMLEYDETKARRYILDRGKLSDVLDGDETPVDVKIDAIWDFVTGVTGSSTPTAEDVLKQRDPASAWVTTDEDVCAPFCVDVEIAYDPGCSVDREWVTLKYFRYEKINRATKDGILKVSGKCNVTEAVAQRIA